MFCKNCGTQINDGDLFCVKCGKRVEAEAAAEPEVKAEAPENKGPATETAQAPKQATPVKKKRKLWKVLVPVAAVVAAASVLVAFNFTKVSNFVTKTVLPADKYYSKVEETQISELASSIAVSYEKSLKNSVDLTDMGVDTAITLELGKDARDLVANYLGAADAEWLEKIGLDLNVSMKDNVFGATIGALLGDDQLISAEALMDMENAAVYFLLPELSTSYIGVDVGYTDVSSYLDSGSYSELAGVYDDLMKAMPDAEVLEEMLNRYLLAAVNSIDNVKKSTEVLEVEDIEQKCTVLRVKLTEKDVLGIVEAILEEAKDDKDLIKVITDFAKKASLGYELDVDEIEDNFEEGIEDLLDSIKDSKAYADSDGKLIMQVWVNSDGEVAGRDVTFEDSYDSFEIKYYMPQSGENFAMELSFSDGYDTVAVTGEGTKTDTEMSGEFVITAADMDLIEVKVEDYQYAGAESGSFQGIFTIKPTEELWEQADLGVPSSLISNFALVLEMSVDEESAEFAISLDNNGEMFAKITASSAAGSAKKEIGTAKDVIMCDDEYDLIDWLMTVDFDAFLKKINETKLPVELTELIEEYCYDIEEMLSYYYYGY